jgi:hypothetical protein
VPQYGRPLSAFPQPSNEVVRWAPFVIGWNVFSADAPAVDRARRVFGDARNPSLGLRGPSLMARQSNGSCVDGLSAWSVPLMRSPGSRSIAAGISEVARRNGVVRGLLTVWRHKLTAASVNGPGFVPVRIASEAGPATSGQPGCLAPEHTRLEMASAPGKIRGMIESEVSGAQLSASGREADRSWRRSRPGANVPMLEGENSVVHQRLGSFIRSNANGAMGSWLSLHGVPQCAAVGPKRPRPSANTTASTTPTRPLRVDRVSAPRSPTDIAKATFAGARTAIPQHRRSRYSDR